MLIERVNCPRGCVNATISESIKRVAAGNSNLLLDSAKSQTPINEVVKVYSCSCCGTCFEVHNPSTGRMVI